MKRKIFSILFALVLAVSLMLVPAALVAAQTGPIVGLWHLDEGSGTDAYDSSGYGNDGTIYGATYVSGKFGSALSFDGINDYVDYGNVTQLDGVSAFTVEFWIKVDSLPFPATKWEGIIARGNSAQRCPWVFGNRGYSNLYMQFETTTGGVADCSFTTADLTAGQWHHVAFTWDGTTVTSYLDGLAGPTDTTSGSVLVNTDGSLKLGYIPGYQYFDGTIDEVRIWNVARTANQIYQSYAALHVDDDGAEWPGAYPTITQALAVANPGDTIIVHQGWYNEQNVWIDKDGITLDGQPGAVLDGMGFGGSIRGILVANGFANANAPDPSPLVAGPVNVTIRGLEVRNFGNEGIRGVKVSGLTLKNLDLNGNWNHAIDIIHSEDVVVKNVKVAVSAGSHGTPWVLAEGIRLQNVASAKVRNATVTGGNVGVNFAYASTGEETTGVIRGCTITGSGNGILIAASSDALVRNNTVMGTSSTSILVGLSGFIPGFPSISNVRLRNNTVSNSGGSGVQLITTSGSVVSNNTVTGSAGHGIALRFASSGNTVMWNTATGNGDGVTSFDLFHDVSSSPNKWMRNTSVTKSGADIP